MALHLNAIFVENTLTELTFLTVSWSWLDVWSILVMHLKHFNPACRNLDNVLLPRVLDKPGYCGI